MAPLPRLDETNLDENMILDPSDSANQFIFYHLAMNGLIPIYSPLDNNPDYDNDDDPVVRLTSNLKIDIDRISPENIGLNPNIRGFNDWANIVLNFHQFGDLANAAVNPVTVHEPTLEELIAFEQELNRDQEVNRKRHHEKFQHHTQWPSACTRNQAVRPTGDTYKRHYGSNLRPYVAGAGQPYQQRNIG